MSKEMLTIALGLFVVVVPFLGIPGSWKTPLFVIAGILLAGVGFLLRGESLARSGRRGDTFAESRPEQPQDGSPQRDHGIGSLN